MFGADPFDIPDDPVDIPGGPFVIPTKVDGQVAVVPAELLQIEGNSRVGEIFDDMIYYVNLLLQARFEDLYLARSITDVSGNTLTVTGLTYDAQEAMEAVVAAGHVAFAMPAELSFLEIAWPPAQEDAYLEDPNLDNLLEDPNLDNLKEVPKLDNLEEVPKLDNLDEVPKLDNLEVPKLDNLEVPKLDDLEVPKLDEIPKLDNLEVPKLDKVPKLDNLEVPKLDNLKEVPKLDNPKGKGCRLVYCFCVLLLFCCFALWFVQL